MIPDEQPECSFPDGKLLLALYGPEHNAVN